MAAAIARPTKLRIVGMPADFGKPLFSKCRAALYNTLLSAIPTERHHLIRKCLSRCIAGALRYLYADAG